MNKMASLSSKKTGFLSSLSYQVRHLTMSRANCNIINSNNNSNKYYDLVVIGGGSGGLACSKEASQLGKKVAVLDYVSPSPQGTSWGLGGTCVNVGCIPKKLMHQASLIHSAVQDSYSYGWMDSNNASLNVTHDWNLLVDNVRNHILSLNWGHRVQLKEKKVDYYNCFGRFVDNHTIEATDKNGKKMSLSADNIVIAVGGRPAFPDQVPGAREFGISSDDIFFLKEPPGKTLVVGASYVALECAGFLNGLGYETSVMIRSQPLKAFDEHLSKLVLDHMEAEGVEFLRDSTPLRVDRIINESGKTELQVSYSTRTDNSNNNGSQEMHKVAVDTVLFATGRRAATTDLKLDILGIQTDVSTCQIPVDDNDATSLPNVFVIGDAALGRPELTPVAIMSGKLLAKRLYSNSSELMDYKMVPTTVFTPLEYGAIGFTERQAIDQFGEENVEHFLYRCSMHFISHWSITYHSVTAINVILRLFVLPLKGGRELLVFI
ncbi:PREDICTED: thioredoxin reductase 2, mitochondrial-like isoform X2 [Amphimedon queenslandica]|uniref:FAD/NAD(P)-binding domain-containing protein n=1 Tax=Amphimedon queenslandica TaxID=400682 RepID=A0AAN0JKD5_AMPQE|nr:PREDICTED: thioredoxin reductase 2, mitochondrial-like isoform X2 [Amphimedon queenslandica]|eukprot:XP_019857476.1 PREDICTED: thioredoxin reductase 2, mitochondrial-like isoform X2 [Amphimedon queenslandica]